MSRRLKSNGENGGGGVDGHAGMRTDNRRSRILIVEDEPAMVQGLRDNFEFEGYEVISTGDGVAGLERALSRPTRWRKPPRKRRQA